MEKTEERLTNGSNGSLRKVYCLNCAYLIDGDSPLRNECGHPQRAIRDRDGLVVRPYANEARCNRNNDCTLFRDIRK